MSFSPSDDANHRMRPWTPVIQRPNIKTYMEIRRPAFSLDIVAFHGIAVVGHYDVS